MLFIVPDDSVKSDADGGPGNSGAQPPASVASEGAASAEEEEVPRFKVELDLDDAPFMEDEKPAPEPEPEPEAPAAEEAAPAEALPLPEPKAAKPKWKERLRPHKKKLIIAGAASALLIVGIVTAGMFFSGTPETPETPETPATPPPAEAPAPPEVEQRTLPDRPPLPPAPEAPKFMISLDNFVIPVQGPEGELRLLFCSFSIPTDDPVLQATLQARMVVVRDGVFFYLSKQDYALLSNPDRAQLKQEIISAINEQISNTEVKDLLFSNYSISAPGVPIQ